MWNEKIVKWNMTCMNKSNVKWNMNWNEIHRGRGNLIHNRANQSIYTTWLVERTLWYVLLKLYRKLNKSLTSILSSIGASLYENIMDLAFMWCTACMHVHTRYLHSVLHACVCMHVTFSSVLHACMCMHVTFSCALHECMCMHVAFSCVYLQFTYS